MFTYLSGRQCLDLTTTLQMRHRPHPVETLLAPGDVEQWAEQAGLNGGVRVDDAGLGQVREVREVIHALCRARCDGRPAPLPDVGRLNGWAAHPPLVPALADGRVRYRGDLGQTLSTLARDAVDLLAGPHAARIRECGHPDCSRLYVDASHAGRRRWCGMAACGNKAKSATYRARRRDGSG